MKVKEIQDILDYLEGNFNNDLNAVQDFLKMKSISATGEGIRLTAETVKGMIEEAGGTSELIETPGHPLYMGV